MKIKVTGTTIVALFLVSVLATALTPSARAHTEENPFVTDLIAGQTMDVGDVSVWNDASHLFVKYETTGDWVMTCTHLAVATSLEEIPQNNNGIPSPGKFPLKEIHSPPVSEHTYSIELDSWAVNTTLYIAAHAVVCGPGQPPTFAQGVLAIVPLYTWSDAINIGTVTASILGDNLIVDFEITFTGWVMLDTHLSVGFTPPTWPPQYQLFPYKHEGLGGVTSDSYIVSLTSLGVECQDILFISAHTYASFPAVSVYRDAWSEYDPSTGWEKFFTVTIPYELVCETAWGNGQRFVTTNWSMHFNYTVQ